MIRNQKHNNYFKIIPKVPYEKSIQLMHDAKLLLLPLYFDNQGVINWFSSKIIEYIGSQNQCLILGDHCEDFRQISKNYPLINTKEICLNILIDAFYNRKKTDQQLSIGKSIDIDQFSLKTLSSRFINLKQ